MVKTYSFLIIIYFHSPFVKIVGGPLETLLVVQTNAKVSRSPLKYWVLTVNLIDSKNRKYTLMITNVDPKVRKIRLKVFLENEKCISK